MATNFLGKKYTTPMPWGRNQSIRGEEDVYNKLSSPTDQERNMRYLYGLQPGEGENVADKLKTAYNTAMIESGANPFGADPGSRFLKNQSSYLYPMMALAGAFKPSIYGTPAGQDWEESPENVRTTFLDFLRGNGQRGVGSYGTMAQTRELLDLASGAADRVNRGDTSGLSQYAQGTSRALSNAGTAKAWLSSVLGPSMGSMAGYMPELLNMAEEQYNLAITPGASGGSANSPFFTWYMRNKMSPGYK